MGARSLANTLPRFSITGRNVLARKFPPNSRAGHTQSFQMPTSFSHQPEKVSMTVMFSPPRLMLTASPMPPSISPRGFFMGNTVLFHQSTTFCQAFLKGLSISKAPKSSSSSGIPSSGLKSSMRADWSVPRSRSRPTVKPSPGSPNSATPSASRNEANRGLVLPPAPAPPAPPALPALLAAFAASSCLRASSSTRRMAVSAAEVMSLRADSPSRIASSTEVYVSRSAWSASSCSLCRAVRMSRAASACAIAASWFCTAAVACA